MDDAKMTLIMPTHLSGGNGSGIADCNGGGTGRRGDHQVCLTRDARHYGVLERAESRLPLANERIDMPSHRTHWVDKTHEFLGVSAMRNHEGHVPTDNRSEFAVVKAHRIDEHGRNANRRHG